MGVLMLGVIHDSNHRRTGFCNSRSSITVAGILRASVSKCPKSDQLSDHAKKYRIVAWVLNTHKLGVTNGKDLASRCSLFRDDTPQDPVVMMVLFRMLLFGATCRPSPLLFGSAPYHLSGESSMESYGVSRIESPQKKDYIV